MDAYTLFAIIAICCTVMIVGVSWAAAWRDKGSSSTDDATIKQINPSTWTYSRTPVSTDKKKENTTSER